MRVPLSWLSEYVEVSVPTAELAERLAVSSCEVERVLYRGVRDLDGNLAHFRVGRVLDAGKHPNADRLQLCAVDVGDPEPRQIVCGAWNFGAGLRPIPGKDLEPKEDEPVRVEIEDPIGCPRYIGRLFPGVTVGPSPLSL